MDLSDTMIDALPDLTLVVRRDGLILSNLGGREIGAATQPGTLRGTGLTGLWPANIAVGLNELIRRALRGRTQSNGVFRHESRSYDVRVRPLGVDRVLMVIRSGVASGELGESDSGDCTPFARKLSDAVANAKLRENQVAVAIAHFVDLPGIVRASGQALGQMLVLCALERMGSQASAAPGRAPRLRAAQLESDQVAVLIEPVNGPDGAAAATGEIRRILAQPISLEGREHRLNPVIGWALYPTDGFEPDTLLDRARANVLDARRPGGGRAVAARSKVSDLESVSPADLERELQWAVERKQFGLEYAPVVEVKERRALALAACLRWNHPVCGPVASEQFTPLLETLNLRPRVDAWTLRRGLSDLARLSRRANTALNFSVSVARQFMDAPTAVEQITRKAASAGIVLSRIDIAIDGKTLAGGNRVANRLRELRQLGARIFLENFGQDEIVLARMSSLPIDGVCIASELISRLSAEAGARAACASAFAIARSFGLISVAVGVATQSELEQLCEYGCGQATGPLFGHPKPLGKW